MTQERQEKEFRSVKAEIERLRELLIRADSYLSLLWHRHVALQSKDADLTLNVERSIGDLRASYTGPKSLLSALIAEAPSQQERGKTLLPKDWSCLGCGHAHYFEADESGFDSGEDIPWGACKTCDCKVPNYREAPRSAPATANTRGAKSQAAVANGEQPSPLTISTATAEVCPKCHGTGCHQCEGD